MKFLLVTSQLLLAAALVNCQDEGSSNSLLDQHAALLDLLPSTPENTDAIVIPLPLTSSRASGTISGTFVVGATTAIDSNNDNTIDSWGGIAYKPFTTGVGNAPPTFFTSVSCTFTMNAGGADMVPYLRKNNLPTSNGASDCTANVDTDSVAPDTEVCSVTSSSDRGDYVYSAVTVIANTRGTYNVDYVCTYEACDGCFSSETTVQILGKGETAMKNLQIGDKVLVGDNYEPIYGFAHLDKSKTTEFLQIYITEAHDSNNHGPLEVTGDHLIWVNNQYAQAQSVKVGDTLRTTDGESTVSKISTVFRNGVYAPLTPSGSLLVNGIAVSSYASVPKVANLLSNLPISYHTANHMALSPVRMLCLGVSSHFCDLDPVSEETSFPVFVKVWLTLVDIVDQQQQQSSAFLQWIFLGLYLSICGPLYGIELVVGAAYAPALFLVAVLMAGLARFKFWKRDSNHDRSLCKKSV